jgi:acid phosphatase
MERASVVNVVIAFCFALAPSFAIAGIPKPDHVVVVVEENRSDNQVYGNSNFPYFNSIANNQTGVNAAKFTDYGGITHPSEPNYIALFSGSTFGISDDNVHPYSTFSNGSNLGAKLLKSGHTFAGYSEDQPGMGSQSSTSGKYVRKHNPWANWQDASIADANELPASVNRSFSGTGNWPSSDFSKLPDVSFVIPNLNNDGHDTSDKTSDNWLKNSMSSYLTWANTHNSLLIVTWDEDEGSGRIATIFAGPMVKPGVYGEPANHYSLLRTLEDMYGLTHDTSNTKNAATLSDVFAPSGSLFVPEPGSGFMIAVAALGLLPRRRNRMG